MRNNSTEEYEKAVEYRYPTGAKECLGKLAEHSNVEWVKTLSTSLVTMDGWYSSRCNLSWKFRSGMCGRAYLQVMVSPFPITVGITFNLLPTPKASEGTKGCDRKLTVENGKIINISAKGIKYGLGIRQLAEQGFLSAPQSGLIRTDNPAKISYRNQESEASKNEKPRSINTGFLAEMMGFPKLWTASPFQKKASWKINI